MIGNVSLALKDVASKVVGIDISQGMVDVVRLDGDIFLLLDLDLHLAVCFQFNKKVTEQLPNGPPMEAFLLTDNLEELPSIMGKEIDCAFVSFESDSPSE